MSAPRESWSRALAAKFRGFFGGLQADDEFDEEIQEHLRLLADRFVAQGMTGQEAAVAARRQFGNTTLLQEDRRALRTFPSVEALSLDLRYAVRTLWKSRRFAAIAIATLALGIGASTAIFSVIDNVLLEPFPYKGASRMVFPRVHNGQQNQDQGRQGYTATEFLEFAENNQVFDGVAAAAEDLVLYKHGEGTDQFYGAHVTPGTFEFFGMPALHGRVMQPSDYEPGAPPVFVLRYKTWIERFHGDPSVLNKSFVLNGTARTLIGIMPPRFGWYEADVMIPEKPVRGGSTADTVNWFMIGRLKPGVTSQQAEADLTLIARRLAKIQPQLYPTQFSVQVRKLGDTVVGNFEATLYTLLGAVGLLLLISCSNVANLMLARATTREKEFALRAALGAGRSRLIRLLLVESLVLAMIAAALGTFLAWGGLKALVAAMPRNMIPAESVIELNAPVLLFTLGIAVITALIFGLAPALQSARRDLNDSLRDSGKGVSGGFRGKWLRDAVVVVEVALSLTLLIGSGLLMRSFVALRQVSLGVRADHVFKAFIVLPQERYKTEEQSIRFFRPLLERLKGLPGVVDATVASNLPPYGGTVSKIEVSGKPHQEDWQAKFENISDDYFQVLRIESKRGRTFSDAEMKEGRKVAVINEAFVRTYFSNDDPIGQHVQFSMLKGAAHDAWFEIVGVVGDVTNSGLQTPVQPEAWLPWSIPGASAQVLMVRTALDPATMQEAVTQQVWAADSGVALAYPGPLEAFIGERLYAGPKFGFLLMTVFGCVGLILVMVGVYSVLAYSTTRRTHEIGIRMALGAKGADVLGMVVKTGLRLVLAGIVIGIAISFLLGRMIAQQLMGVTSYDPATLGAMTLLLTVTATIACWIPARKAARVDPTIALRYE